MSGGMPQSVCNWFKAAVLLVQGRCTASSRPLYCHCMVRV